MVINWIAVLAATLSAFVLGFLWYNPKTFGKAWMKSIGIDPNNPPKPTSGMGKIFGLAFLFTFIEAICISFFFYSTPEGVTEECLNMMPHMNASTGAFFGFVTGLGFTSMGICVNALYEQKSATYMLINAGYQTTALTLIGLILGAWH